jgi:hypothetical protein
MGFISALEGVGGAILASITSFVADAQRKSEMSADLICFRPLSLRERARVRGKG